MSADKPLSRWARAHGKGKATPQYVPKFDSAPEPAPAEIDDMNDDHELLPDRGPATLSDEDVAAASFDPDDPRIQIARMVVQILNNYQSRKGA